jgi:hypothetical protein
MGRSSTSTEAPSWLEPLAHRPFPVSVQFAPDVRTAAEILDASVEPCIELAQTTEAA